MATRRAWSDLGERSRGRYLSAGRSGKLTGTAGLSEDQVRRYYESGQDLAGAYGPSKYSQERPRGSAPREATDRAAQYLDTPQDLADLERWRDRTAPAWLPRNRAAMGTDTAAILSQIPNHPENWKHVQLTMLTNGRVQMTVTPKGRGPVTIVTLPDSESMHEVTRFLRDPPKAGATSAERKRLEKQWSRAHPKVNVTGTDQAVNGRPLPVTDAPPTRTGSPGRKPSRPSGRSSNGRTGTASGSPSKGSGSTKTKARPTAPGRSRKETKK